MAADVPVQLAAYSDAARRVYGAFLVLDMVFPLAAGLVVAAIIAFGLRQVSPAIYLSMDRKKLWPVLLVATAFDWVENVTALALIPGGASDVGPCP